MTTAVPTKTHRLAHVRFLDGDTSVRLQLQLPNTAVVKTFQRPAAELFAKTRQRIALAATNALTSGDAKSGSRKNRNKGKRGKLDGGGGGGGGGGGMPNVATSPPPVIVRFFAGGDELSLEEETIGTVLALTTSLTIGDVAEYKLVKNAPSVERLTLLDPPLTGSLVVPFAETQHCSAAECSWRWIRISSGGEEQECGSARQYAPTEADVGCRLRVECSPPSSSDDDSSDDEPFLGSTVQFTTSAVQPSPQRDVFDSRRELGKIPAHADDKDPSFRIMSYNVLFDGYTTNHTKQSKFAYVPPPVLKEAYRMQLIAQEIEESNSDIVCLQEMGGAVFATFFEPVMAALGYQTLYAGKTGSTIEGCAIFVRSSCFEVVEHYTTDITSLVKQSSSSAVQAVLDSFPEVAKGIEAAPTIAQIAVLQHKRDPSKRLILSNTHLFFRYDADLMRLLQAVALLEEVAKKRAQYGESTEPAVIMAGDYNAFPEAAAVRYLLDGRVDSSHRHVQSAQSFRWDGVPTIEELRMQGGSTIFETSVDENVRVLPVEFAHDLKFESGCGIPEFTNYASTPGHLFAGTLDYILLGVEQLYVRQVFPQFSREDVSKEVALPSTEFPSDHVSLICDLGWRTN